MAYPVTIPILAHGFVLVAYIVLPGLTGDINAAGVPGEATGTRLHDRRHVNEVEGPVDRFRSVHLQQLSHPAYYVKDSPVESDPFLNNNHNLGKIQQTFSPEGVEGHLHSDASGKVAVSGMYGLDTKREVPPRTTWEAGVSNDDGLVTTDQFHNRLLGEGNYYHDMNTNDRDNVPLEQKVMYTYGMTLKIEKSAINYGTVNRMQQLETATSERNQAQYLIFGENYHHRTKGTSDDKANRANIYNVSPNANGIDGTNTGNSFKFDDRIADQNMFYPVAKRNEAMSPSYTYRMSPSDEENSVNSVGYAQRDSKLTLTSDIDDNAHGKSPSTPERPPINQEGLHSDWDEFAPKSGNIQRNHLIIKGIRGPDLTVKANTNWSGQKSISADLVAGGAYVDVSRRIDQSVMDRSEETDITANLNNADTDIFTDSNGHGKVDLIDFAVNSLPDILNEEISDEDSQRVVDPNNRLHNADQFTHQSDPTVGTLIHGIGPNDSVDRFSDVSSSAQLMPKEAVRHDYNDYYWTSPVVNSPKNKGNGIHLQQQSKSRSYKEVFGLNGYIIPQQLYQQPSSRWSVGKHKSQKNVYELNGLKQKTKSNLAKNIHRESSNLNQNSNIESQMVETSEGHTHFSQPSNIGYRKVNTEERDVVGHFLYEDIKNSQIQQDLSVPKQEQSNKIDRDRKNKGSLKRSMQQKNELDAIYLARDRHAGPGITQTKSDKPNETSSGRSSHTATEQLHSSASNKTNVGPFGLNKNQATQESRMLKEKSENLHAARLNEKGILGIEQLHILEIPYRRPKRPNMNLNDNMAIPQQSDAEQEKSNMVKVAYWDRTSIEPPLMDIDLANGQPSTSYPSSPQSDSTPESTSQIDLNAQFADGVILGNTRRKAVSQSISIDPLNSQMSLKYYSKSDWSHTAYDHVQQSKEFTQGIFSSNAGPHQ